MGAEYEATRNPCVVCAPLGATLAFAGVRRGMTLLHGSQGCATYIRRYAISHFREPLDAGSSSFTEETAVFGGRKNLRLAFENMSREYRPELIGVATTCLAETIGEDGASARRALADYVGGDYVGGDYVGGDYVGGDTSGGPWPLLATVSTPSYRGDHREGFRLALRALMEAACPVEGPGAGGGGPGRPVAVFPTILSPEDLRELKTVFRAFGLDAVLVSDYSDTLDGGPWTEHRLLPEGGTPVESLKALSRASCSVEFGSELPDSFSGAAYLEASHGVRRHSLGLPIGIRATDRFMEALSEIAGRPVPAAFLAERGRLLDSYVDAHKRVFGKRALLYGDEDLRDALAAFCEEIGMVSVVAEGEGRDFASVEAAAEEAAGAGGPVDLVLGNSKGYKSSKKLKVPLVRAGFPIHDRFGGQRIRLLSYRGSQELFDRIVNALIEREQEDNHVGYTFY
jgi:nitrogenase molybdenum-iron protein NifN